MHKTGLGDDLASGPTGELTLTAGFLKELLRHDSENER